MTVFHRRHPNAPKKIKNYLNMFEQISTEYSASNTNSYKEKTKKLNDQLGKLTYGLKQSLVSRSALTRVRHDRNQLPKIVKPTSTFITGHISKPTTAKSTIAKPQQCLAISRAMPTRPMYGAYRFFDSIASQEMKQDEIELRNELAEYPQLAAEYSELNKNQVDPFLHVGGFMRSELLKSPDFETNPYKLYGNPETESSYIEEQNSESEYENQNDGMPENDADPENENPDGEFGNGTEEEEEEIIEEEWTPIL